MKLMLFKEKIVWLANHEGALKKLDRRERGVLTMRYGLDGEGTHTLEDVGKVYGVTRERIRQIEEKALEKIHLLDKGVDGKV